MFKTIEGAADCEIRSVIRFLNAMNVESDKNKIVYETLLEFCTAKCYVHSE